MSAEGFMGALPGLVGGLVLLLVLAFVAGWGLAPDPPVLAHCLELYTGNEGAVVSLDCQGDTWVRQQGDRVEVGCVCR